MTGKVALVGAGPGDVGLLTLRGKELLERADTVVYDALVGPAVLALIPPGAKCIDVGKRAGRHTKEQEEINDLLLREALAGKAVVRLKGGDPFLFGRGGEELELLARRGVPFEVVPGVTSALAVPAYAGIPVTHRDFCSSVHIITAHKRAGEPLALDFEALVKLEGTLVFLMGVSSLPELCAGLIGAGAPPDLTAAVLECGTSAAQNRIAGTLATLPQRAAHARTPAVIVVGRVCSLADSFAWAEHRPLFGRRFLITRPRERAGTLAARLRELGGEVVELPTIELALDESADLSALHGTDWLVFTSPSGVGLFLSLLRLRGADVRCLAGIRLAALGAGTAAELARAGLLAQLVPASYDAAALGEALAQAVLPGQTVCIFRARQGSEALTQALRAARGVRVRDIALYDTHTVKSPVLEPLALLRGADTWAVFTSASTVRGFAAAADGAPLEGVRALCIGRQTQAQAQAFGMTTYVSRQATVDSLVELALHITREEH